MAARVRESLKDCVFFLFFFLFFFFFFFFSEGLQSALHATGWMEGHCALCVLCVPTVIDSKPVALGGL